MITIRQEASKDYADVYAVVKEAFAAAEHSDGTEQDLVVSLRESDAFIPDLSLVAEIGDKIVGYILFTKALVGNTEVLALAPLAVLPAYQKMGVGTRLIERGHKIAKELGFHYSIVLGSNLYYPKFGYVSAGSLGIELPAGFPEEFFMAAQLDDHAEKLTGSVTYAKEFGL